MDLSLYRQSNLYSRGLVDWLDGLISEVVGYYVSGVGVDLSFEDIFTSLRY